MDTARVDLLIRYAIGVAGLKDPGERELGEIHILKYVYLADLAYAESHGGETFTGTPWQFYKFGPWCQPVQARIRPVVEAAGALERTFTSTKFDGEGTRWRLREEDAGHVVTEAEGSLPWAIQRAVKNAVKEFGDDTSSLLHRVYTTRPMLQAAPNELLRFEPAPDGQKVQPVEQIAPRTAHEQKKQMQKLENLRSAFRARLATSRPKLIAPNPPPIYDDVFEAGVRALDADMGEPLVREAGELVFDPEVWKSRGRSDPSIP